MKRYTTREARQSMKAVLEAVRQGETVAIAAPHKKTVYLTIVKPPPSTRELFERWEEAAVEITRDPLDRVRERVGHRKVQL
jgi:antitoxin (DNA-binding transcriptional repressor) of toxin-antitoxin stability system